jgi:hypothetical protein
MSLLKPLKSVPEGLKPQGCKRTKPREPPPVPYVPTKDEVQGEVAKLRNLEIKTIIEKDTTLNFPVWHKNGMQKAFLMHVTVVLDAIKKNVVISRTARRLRRFTKKQRKPLSQPGLLCCSIPAQRYWNKGQRVLQEEG